METLSRQQVALTDGLDDWRVLAQGLHARFRAADLVAAARFAGAVAALPASGEHVDLRLDGGAVDVRVCTRVDGLWLTADDVALARAVAALAAEHGLVPEPTEVTQVELALDTADDARLGPFWSAVLTGSADNTVLDSVIDPTGRMPSMWFQGTEPHEAPRQRWHLDVWVAPEVAASRIAMALAAGGTVVDESQAPSFTVLADPDGNKVCVCTSLDRA
jgi:4a-hydroxytetrahydrobiopterin dehydratase